MFKLIIILKPHCLLMRTCKAAGRPVHAARVPLAWLKRRTLSVAQAFSVVPCLCCCSSLFPDSLPPFLPLVSAPRAPALLSLVSNRVGRQCVFPEWPLCNLCKP